MNEQDPFVRNALETLPIPDHGSDFWSRLDRALENASDNRAPQSLAADAESGPVAVAPLAGRDVEVELAPHDAGREPRRRRGLAARVAGIAATVAVVIAGGALVAGQDGDTGPDLSSVPGPTEPGSLPPETSEVTTTVVAPSEDARDAVLTFVDALGAGDLETAASLFGVRSEAYAESQFGSVDDYLVQASEGYGAWATSTDREAQVIMLDPGAAVVLLSGTRSAEGVVEHRLDAIPVQHAESAGVWLVEPLAFGDFEVRRFDILDPVPEGDDAPLAVTRGGTVQVGVTSPGTMYFSLDGTPPTAVPTVDGNRGETATFTIPGSAPTGERVLTVAYISDSGERFMARATRLAISD